MYSFGYLFINRYFLIFLALFIYFKLFYVHITCSPLPLVSPSKASVLVVVQFFEAGTQSYA